VTLGEVFEDLVFLDLPRLPKLGEEIKTDRFLRSPGGGALITAVAASRLGTRCRVVSALGDEAVALLRAEGIQVRNLRRRGEAHAISAALSTRRDRSFVTFNGVNDRLEPQTAGDLDLMGLRLEPRARPGPGLPGTGGLAGLSVLERD